jgi:hypothetical protein
MNKLKLNAGEYDTYLLYFTKYGCGLSTLVPAVVIFTYPVVKELRSKMFRQLPVQVT